MATMPKIECVNESAGFMLSHFQFKSDKITRKAIMDIIGTEIIIGRCMLNQNCSLNHFIFGKIYL
jgi:hypothetical protein